MASDEVERVGATMSKTSPAPATKVASVDPAAKSTKYSAKKSPATTRAHEDAPAGKQAGGQRRSLPADDPLAPERTRWLADTVGGSGILADMLGVSRSQTSRWASGKERPGVESAPLLIDLEHVLARVRLVWAEPAATTWMTSANAYLSGARPVDVLRTRGTGPVLEALDAGAWNGAA